jgi:hypothetical protein
MLRSRVNAGADAAAMLRCGETPQKKVNAK